MRRLFAPPLSSRFGRPFSLGCNRFFICVHLRSSAVFLFFDTAWTDLTRALVVQGPVVIGVANPPGLFGQGQTFASVSQKKRRDELQDRATRTLEVFAEPLEDGREVNSVLAIIDPV